MKRGKLPKCFVCEINLKFLYKPSSMNNAESWPLENSNFITFNAGFGSKFNSDKITIAICDNCLESKNKNFYKWGKFN